MLDHVGNPDHHRRSIRLKQFDYTQPRAYFITIVTHQRKVIFGEIVGGEVLLSPLGIIVQREWEYLTRRFSTIRLDVSKVMPNHFHGVILKGMKDSIQLLQKPRIEHFQSPVPDSIPTIIRSFKASVTHRAKLMMGDDFQVWQRNYYEHMIRDDEDMDRIRHYIETNPWQWEQDSQYPFDTR